jgi:hypothetical protein
MKTIVAYTAIKPTYPEYINISEENDVVRITIRADSKAQDGMLWCGETTHIDLDRDRAVSILQQALDKLNADG